MRNPGFETDRNAAGLDVPRKIGPVAGFHQVEEQRCGCGFPVTDFRISKIADYASIRATKKGVRVPRSG